MLGLSQHAPDARCGLILDIGSSSVGAAIVVSEVDEPQPTTVWTHIERCPISDSFNITDLAKRITTAVTNVGLEIGGNGLKSLAEHDGRLRIHETMVSVAAPWSYTVPKRITYAADDAFTVTETLLTELARTAERQTTEEYGKIDLFNSLGLEVLSNDSAQFLANGYAVQSPVGQTITDLVHIQNITIAQKQLLEAVREVHSTVVPKSQLTIGSFIQQMRKKVLTHTIPDHTYGLVDVGGDATEVGVVSNDHLSTVINNQWGYNSLVRELAAITKQPTSAALTMLQESADGAIAHLSDAQQEAWQTVCTEFVATQADLIGRSAAMSELPEHYAIHTDTTMRPIVMALFKRAIANSTGNATVSLVSEKLTDVVSVAETRMALSIAVFHTTSKA